jgi:hypothetical protein
MEAKEIVTVVEDYFNLKEGTCYRKRRLRGVTKYRNIVAYFLTLKGWSTNQIADFFKMQRTTFYYSVEAVKNDINTNRIYREQIAELKDIVFGDGAEHNSNQETKVILTHKWLPRNEERIFVQPIEEVEE